MAQETIGTNNGQTFHVGSNDAVPAPQAPPTPAGLTNPIQPAPQSAPAVITSGAAQDKTQQNMQTLNQAQATLAGGQTFTLADGSQYDVSGKQIKPPTSKPSATPSNTNQPAFNNSNTQTTSLTPTTTDGTSKPTVEQQLSDSMSAVDQDTQSYVSMLDTQMNKISATTAAAIDNIKATYARRIQETETVNKSILGGLTTAGYRTGRTRYANELQTSILSTEEKAGIQRIADLNQEELSLVQQAQDAADEKSFALLDKRMTALSEARKEKNNTLIQLNQMAMDNERLALEKSADARSQIQLQQQMDQYETEKQNTNKQFLLDNNVDQPYYEVGGLVFNSQTGAPEFKNVGGTIQTMDGYQFTNSQDFFDKTGLKSFDQIQQISKPKFNKDNILGSADSGYFSVDPYSGEVTQLTEPQSDPSKGIEYGVIGQDEYGVNQYGFINKNTGEVSALGGTLGSNDSTKTSAVVNDTINGAISAIRSKMTSPTQAKALAAEVNQAVANGDYQGAVDSIVSNAIDQLPTEQKNKAYGRNQAIAALDAIQQKLTEYQAAGGNTSVLTGTDEQIRQKLGNTKDPKLADIANTINLALVDYRRAVSGAAFTPSEADFYEKLFPSIKNKTELNDAKIGSLKDAFNRNQKSDLSTVLGSSNYDKVMALPEALKMMDSLPPLPGDPNFVGPVSPSEKGGLSAKVPAGTNKTLTSVLTKQYPEGANGGQCGDWVRAVTSKLGVTYPPLGDSLKSKVAAVQKYGTSAKNASVGSVIVTKENPTYGHVAYIIGRNAQGYIVAESNFKQSDKVSYGRVIPYNSSKIVGVINPSKIA